MIKRMNNTCIFCNIIQGNISVIKIFEDNNLLAFHDIEPIAEKHALVIPKIHITGLDNLKLKDNLLITHITLTIPKIANILGLNNGFKTIINTGKEGGQKIFHLHYHICGGRSLI